MVSEPSGMFFGTLSERFQSRPVGFRMLSECFRDGFECDGGKSAFARVQIMPKKMPKSNAIEVIAPLFYKVKAPS